MVREEVVRDRGRLIQFTQFQKRASEAGVGAGRWIARETALPAGAHTLGITRREREGGSLVQKCGRLSRFLLDQIEQVPGLIELSADTEPCRELEAEFRRQLARVGDGEVWFVKRHGGAVPTVRGHLAGTLHACSPGKNGN